MDWLDLLVGETRARLLRLVRRVASSISDLAEPLAISENAVRAHVAGLERDGLVRQAAVRRSTGGKPARLYELTPEAEELFPKAYAPVLVELVRALREAEGEAAALSHLRRVGRRLGARAGAAGSASEPVAAAVAVLESIGGSVEIVEEVAGWRLQADGCPLAGVVAEEPAVCALVESLLAEVTGRSVAESCERIGRPRCGFWIAATPVAAGGS